jgi:hypothetical protein
MELKLADNWLQSFYFDFPPTQSGNVPSPVFSPSSSQFRLNRTIPFLCSCLDRHFLSPFGLPSNWR